MAPASIYSLDQETLDNIFSHLLAPSPEAPLVLYPQYSHQDEHRTTRFPRSAIHCSNITRRADSLPQLWPTPTEAEASAEAAAPPQQDPPHYNTHLEATFRNTRRTCRAFANLAVVTFFSKNTFQANNLTAFIRLRQTLPLAWRPFIRALILRPFSLFVIESMHSRRIAIANALSLFQPFRCRAFEGLRSVEVRLPSRYCERKLRAAVRNLKRTVPSLRELRIGQMGRKEAVAEDRVFKKEDCRGVFRHACLGKGAGEGKCLAAGWGFGLGESSGTDTEEGEDSECEDDEDDEGDGEGEAEDSDWRRFLDGRARAQKGRRGVPVVGQRWLKSR